MDVIEVAEPAVEAVIDVVPVAAEQAIHALFTTGNIIVIESKDLKAFAIKAGAVVAYGAFMRWQWKKHWRPMLDEHKEQKARKKAEESAKRAEKAVSENGSRDHGESRTLKEARKAEQREDLKARAMNLKTAGRSNAQIARDLGLSESSVRALLQQMTQQ